MYALVFEGGGAKGSYQVGACKAIFEKNIEIDAVVGTSIGSLNGAMIAQGDFEKLYGIWDDISPSKVLGIDDGFREIIRKFNLQSLFYAFDKTKEFIERRGFDTVLIKSIIEENVDEEKLRKSSMDFGLVTLSLTDGKPLELFKEEIPAGKVHEYLMASANFPAFKQERIDGKIMVDGGFYNNFPIEMLVKKGYVDIIAPRIFGIGRIKKFSEKKLNIIYINPSDELGGTLDFDNAIAKRNLRMGYFDARRVFEGLKGRKYYFNSDREEDYFLNAFLNTKKENVFKIADTLGFKGNSHRRLLMESIIPGIADMLGIDENATYEEIFFALMEFMASETGAERFKIYDLDELEYIRMCYKNGKRKSSDLSIVRQILPKDMIAKFDSENVLRNVAGYLFC